MSRTYIALAILCSCWFSEQANAQNDSLPIYEAQMAKLGDSLLGSQRQSVRIDAAKKLIPIVRQALKQPGAIDYPFDKVTYMSKLKPTDGTFRIFGWVLKLDANKYRYFGVVLKRAAEGGSKYYPLFDNSYKYEKGLEDSIFTNETWYGAHYYELHEAINKEQKQYILFGWDGNNNLSNKKIIEVFSFGEDGKPRFGAPLFRYNRNNIVHRVIHEFNSRAIVSVAYDKDRQLIIFPHLVPDDPKNVKERFTYIPDGSYDYFRFKKGMWYFGKDVYAKYKSVLAPKGL